MSLQNFPLEMLVMKRIHFHIVMLCALLVCVKSGVARLMVDQESDRRNAAALYQQNNFAEAFELYKSLALDPTNASKFLAEDMTKATSCLNHLNRINEIDSLMTRAVDAHSKNWRLLNGVARIIQKGEVPHSGYLIGGKFERGYHRGGGKQVSSVSRDRVYAIQLLRRATDLANKDNTAIATEKSEMHFLLAQMIGDVRFNHSWLLQDLTNLDELPDYEDGQGRRGHGFSDNSGGRNPGFGTGGGMFSVPTQFGGGGYSGRDGAPVDEDGSPVFYRLPASWADAKNDGERWRWAIQEAAKLDTTRAGESDLQWARFLRSEFGVISQPTPQFGATKSGNEGREDLPAWVLHELTDSETVAQLASGIAKIHLPDEYNHIAVLKKVIARNDKWKRDGLSELYSIRTNRHQFPEAAKVLEEQLELARTPGERKLFTEQLKQIQGNWLQILPTLAQTSNGKTNIDIRYRNGSAIDFTVRPVRVDALLSDVKAYLQSSPQRLDGQQIEIERIGYRLLTEAGKKYLDRAVASWTLPLESPANHFDATTSVNLPVQKAGAYLLAGTMKDGNTTQIVIWLNDTSLVRKRIDKGTLHYLADAVSGKPIANANIEFFGYRQERFGRTQQYKTSVRRFADRTNNDGICIPDAQQLDRQHRWLVIATTADGRLAYDGFNRIWSPQAIRENSYSTTRVYCVTDRPVYRPGHKVDYKLWLRQPRFHEDDAKYANQAFVLQLRSPQNVVVFEKSVTTDRWAGVAAEYELPEDAQLGRYRLMIGNKIKTTRTRVRNGRKETYTVDQFRQLGQGSFQVEEYRKPEFEVIVDAPTEPVKLGEKVSVDVSAKYFFGAPVTEATVKYKVTRTKKDARWFPRGRWDWLYSPGYWWFAPDYDWYPGWTRWGCVAPTPSWRNWSPDPPETVLDGEAQIGQDGRLALEIDTVSALREHGDSDHNYHVSVEVVDQSRRTIIGIGDILVARDPFRVFVWPNRGHYQTGSTAEFGIQARTPDGKPLQATGKAVLLALSYTDGEPQETEVESWDITSNDKGRTNLKMVVPRAGQYRMSTTITDSKGNSQEGGYVFYVRGPNSNGEGFRFNDLELISEKQEYQPGESINLQVNTNQIGSTVLLFVRPVNGLCPEPQLVRIEGKSTTIPIAVAKSDMPNFFVEALTISGGRLVSEMKEIIVPPVRKIANVEVLPSSENYRPGEEATVQLKLTDIDGNPFSGDTVLSVYDASLESIAASNIPEIRAFFWNVKRRHSISNASNLGMMTSPIVINGQEIMSPLSDGGPFWGGFGFGGGGMGGTFGGPVRRSLGRGMPMAESAMEAAPMAAMAKKTSDAPSSSAGAVQPAIRSNFADTAYWVASATANSDGLVEVKFTVPDNLTTWKIKAWTLGEGTRVGSGTSDIICSKDLIIRPQTPRFFTERDQITLSAVVHNYLDTAKSAQVVIEVEGGQLELQANSTQTVNIPAGGEVRVDWDVSVVASGTAKVRMKALTDEESDATELSVPCHVHGILKTESFTGVIKQNQNSATVDINVPAERIEEQSRLEIRYSPSLAGAMVDALPYLIDYPYGCTEQTLNRFLPAAITQKTLINMGVSMVDVKNKRTNLNSQELGSAADRAEQWKRYDANPVFDEAELSRIVKTGVTDLTNMQLSDGGWGWFSGYGERSTAHLTSQVVHGLGVAVRNDVPVLPDILKRGIDWLKNHQQEELKKLREGDWRRNNSRQLEGRNARYKLNASNLDAFVAFVLAENEASDSSMSDYLYRDRADLSVYAKALTGLVLHFENDLAKRDLVLQNIEQFLVQDDENQTAYLRMAPNSWWYWYGSENEAMARYLQLLLQVRPKDPTAPRLVKYLLNNRKHGTYWRSTRDTAMIVEAMADYIAVSGESKPDMTVEVFLDGRLQKTVRVTALNLFTFDNVVLLEGDAVKSGAHQIELRRTGRGPLYYNAYLTNFTKEDNISATGLEVKVARRFFKLEAIESEGGVRGNRGQVVRQSETLFKRTRLESLATVKSGELIEVELLIDSKNDYEYLLLEDRKPSGFETDDQRSGYFNTGLRAYRELRDDRVSFFLKNLARGNHSMTYRIRAESPSQKVSALPAKIEGMYAPELVGNSSEFKLRVSDEH